MRISVFIGLAVVGLWAVGNRFRHVSPHSPLSLIELRTTDGAIALGNLEAQIEGERRLAAHAPLTIKQRAGIIDLLTVRGQILGRIADYEEADALAEQLVHDEPTDGVSYIARAHTRSIFHRFNDALADLDRAEALGIRGVSIDSSRAAIFQATARYGEALKLRDNKKQNISSLSALGSLHSEMGLVKEAEQFFDKAPLNYRDVSPFPIAWLYFQQGSMWMRQGKLARAHEFFANAHERIPAYAAAKGHLAEVEAAMGNREHAIELLRPLAETSDDPDYAAQLARIYLEAGKPQEADPFKAKAAKRYDELMEQHPEAFADHAAEFWLGAGQDPVRAMRYAVKNLEVRKTARGYELMLMSALAANNPVEACNAANAAATFPRPWPNFSALIKRGQGNCPRLPK